MNGPNLIDTQAPAVDWSGPRPIIEFPAQWELCMTIVLFIAALAGLYYAFRLSRRAGNLSPLLIYAGASLAVTFEPAGDLMAHVTFHHRQLFTLTGSYGFHVPLWMWPAYAVSAGLGILWVIDTIEAGVSLRKWMTMFFGSVVAMMLFELPMIYIDSIRYFAPQPLSFAGYPLWMAFANAAGLFFVPGTILYFLTTKSSVVRGSNAWVLLVLTPMLIAGAHVAGAFPHGYAMTASKDPLWINCSAVIVMLITTMEAWLCGRLVCEAAPARATALQAL